MISWTFKYFDELTLNEFHDLLALRINVFVVEQNCPYPELDGKDKQSDHLVARDKHGEIVATLRVLPPGLCYNEVAIGRIVTAESVRGLGIGHDMMRETMQFIEQKYGRVPIRISAQQHLENFYSQHHFKSTGKEYLEDGIPHIEMLYKP